MANVLLIGMGETTLSALESLVAECNVQGLIRDVDTNSNSDDPVVNRALELGVPVFSDVSQKYIKSLVLNLKPDCVVVSSYNRIFKPELIRLSRFVNVHYSPLPHYRGRANVNWALINNEPCAAITIHKITNEELDAGNILFQAKIHIGFNDTVTDIYQQLNELQRKFLGETVIQLLNGYEGVPQDSAEATYGCSRVPEDGEINWSASTKNIYYLVRALVAPFPGAYTYFQGKRLMVWKAKPLNEPPCYVGRIPGRVIGISKSEGYVDVLTGDGVMRIFEVQFEENERTAAANVIKSVRSTLGLRMSDLLNHIQTLEQEIGRLRIKCRIVEY